MFSNIPSAETRVLLSCTAPGCGRRVVSVPLSTYQQAPDIACDRCGGPMRVIGSSAGADKAPHLVVWSDRSASPSHGRRASDVAQNIFITC